MSIYITDSTEVCSVIKLVRIIVTSVSGFLSISKSICSFYYGFPFVSVVQGCVFVVGPATFIRSSWPCSGSTTCFVESSGSWRRDLGYTVSTNTLTLLSCAAGVSSCLVGPQPLRRRILPIDSSFTFYCLSFSFFSLPFLLDCVKSFPRFRWCKSVFLLLLLLFSPHLAPTDVHERLPARPAVVVLSAASKGVIVLFLTLW